MNQLDQREKLAIYPNTVLEIVDGPTIDLRKPLSAAARKALARVGLAHPFAVITAENPCGEHVDDAETVRSEVKGEARNAMRVRLFEQQLAERHLQFRIVDGVSPDGSYRERGCAIVMPRPDAMALARELDQLAIFWYDGERFWLVPVAIDEEPQPLPPESASTGSAAAS